MRCFSIIKTLLRSHLGDGKPAHALNKLAYASNQEGVTSCSGITNAKLEPVRRSSLHSAYPSLQHRALRREARSMGRGRAHCKSATRQRPSIPNTHGAINSSIYIGAAWQIMANRNSPRLQPTNARQEPDDGGEGAKSRWSRAIAAGGGRQSRAGTPLCQSGGTPSAIITGSGRGRAIWRYTTHHTML
jgi:hypothetical protein